PVALIGAEPLRLGDDAFTGHDPAQLANDVGAPGENGRVGFGHPHRKLRFRNADGGELTMLLRLRARAEDCLNGLRRYGRIKNRAGTARLEDAGARASALARLEARIALVDDEHAALAPDDPAVLVTVLDRLQ